MTKTTIISSRVNPCCLRWIACERTFFNTSTPLASEGNLICTGNCQNNRNNQRSDGAPNHQNRDRLYHQQHLFHSLLPLLGIEAGQREQHPIQDRKSTRLNSSHVRISYAVFCLK